MLVAHDQGSGEMEGIGSSQGVNRQQSAGAPIDMRRVLDRGPARFEDGEPP